MKKIAIIGATGKVGSKVAGLLLVQNQHVKLIARSADKLAPFTSKGAEIYPISTLETDKLTGILRESDVVLTMIASNHQATDFMEEQRQQADAQVEAIKRSGVKYVVNLSSVGCHVIEGNGVINGLTEMEVKLNQLKAVNVLHLRPTYYMENSFYSMELIRHKGINGLPINGDKTFPMIATQDVALVIAERLMKIDFTGKSVAAILGPKDYSPKEMTRLIGAAIGLPELPYVQLKAAEMIAGAMQAGGSKDFAERYAELMVATDKGLLNYHQRTPENTTPTTLQQFTENVFAPVYLSGN